MFDSALFVFIIKSSVTLLNNTAAILACSAKLLTGLYILLALISFIFFFFISFLTISQRTIISGCAGLIFTIFSPSESVLVADDRSGPFFRYLKDVAMATNFVKKWQTPLLHRSGIAKQNGISLP